LDSNWVYMLGVAALSNLFLWVWKPWARAYAGEKGKNLARKEDLDKILAEIRAVTRTTEEIKADVNGGLWARQMHWNQKRDLYFEVIKLIAELAEAYHRAGAALESGSDPTGDLHGLHYRLDCVFRLTDLFADEKCFAVWKEYKNSRDVPPSPNPEWTAREWFALLDVERRVAALAKDDLKRR